MWRSRRAPWVCARGGLVRSALGCVVKRGGAERRNDRGASSIERPCCAATGVVGSRHDPTTKRARARFRTTRTGFARNGPGTAARSRASTTTPSARGGRAGSRRSARRTRRSCASRARAHAARAAAVPRRTTARPPRVTARQRPLSPRRRGATSSEPRREGPQPYPSTASSLSRRSGRGHLAAFARSRQIFVRRGAVARFPEGFRRPGRAKGRMCAPSVVTGRAEQRGGGCASSASARSSVAPTGRKAFCKGVPNQQRFRGEQGPCRRYDPLKRPAGLQLLHPGGGAAALRAAGLL